MRYIYQYKKYSMIILLISITSISLVLTSCSTVDRNASIKYGNIMSNINNYGLATEYQGWTYAILGDGIYRMMDDGTEIKKISDNIGYYINVWDDWIYYSKAPYGEVYRMTIDGAKEVKINNEPSGLIIVADGWIYYRRMIYPGLKGGDVQFCIKKMRINGLDETTIVSESIDRKDVLEVGSFYLHQGWVYYKSPSDEYRLYKITTDGTEKTKVSNEIFTNKYSLGRFIIDGSWVYYTQPNDEDKLYRMKLDGTKKELIIDSDLGDINITENYIFYINGSDRYRLYRVKKDGTEKIKLSNYSVSEINIVGNWVYCQDFNCETTIYKIRTDGSTSINTKDLK